MTEIDVRTGPYCILIQNNLLIPWENYVSYVWLTRLEMHDRISSRRIVYYKTNNPFYSLYFNFFLIKSVICSINKRASYLRPGIKLAAFLSFTPYIFQILVLCNPLFHMFTGAFGILILFILSCRMFNL